MRFLRGLSGTFIIAFALTSALPLALVAFFAVRNFNRSIEGEYRDRLAAIAALRAGEIIAHVEAKRAALETLANLPPFADDVSSLLRKRMGKPRETPLHDRIRSFLRLAAASDPSFAEISLADDAGLIHVSSNAEREGTAGDGEAWLIGARNAPYTGPLERASNGHLVLTIAVPAGRGEPALRGTIVARVDLSAASGVAENLAGLGGTEGVYLISPSGGILAAPEDQWMRSGSLDTRRLAERCFAPEFPPLERADDGSALRALHRLPDRGACVVAEIPRSEAFRPLALFRNFMVATSVFALLIAVAFGLGIARAVIRQIIRLKQTARAVAGGDLTQPIQSAGTNEIAELARELDLMRQNLSRASERERTLGAMKSEFIFIAAHQLRTPLSGVKWALKTLLAGDVGRITRLQRRYAERAYESNERMIRLVSDLLDVSRLEEGKFGYEFAVNDFRAFVESLAGEYRPRFEEKRIGFDLHMPGTRMPVLFDPERLALALRNVIENALNYTPAGGRVSLGVTESPDAVTLELADTGVGIPQRQQEKLFTKFFRGENVIRMQTEGTGLGLFIARNIVAAHGGTITIASEEGKGTAVTIRIPRSHAPNPPGPTPS